jgi:FMN reductase
MQHRRTGGSADLGKRIARAATELTLLLRTGATGDIAENNWGGYSHQLGGNATRAGRSIEDVDFDTDLMRLAAGGRPA